MSSPTTPLSLLASRASLSPAVFLLDAPALPLPLTSSLQSLLHVFTLSTNSDHPSASVETISAYRAALAEDSTLPESGAPVEDVTIVAPSPTAGAILASLVDAEKKDDQGPPVTLHVSAADLSAEPSLTPALSDVLGRLPEIGSDPKIQVVFSSTANEIVSSLDHIAAVRSSGDASHIVHVFDAIGAADELIAAPSTATPPKALSSDSLVTVNGPANAETVIISVGWYAQAGRAAARRVRTEQGLSVVSLRVVRPFTKVAEALKTAVGTASKVLVFGSALVEDVKTALKGGKATVTELDIPEQAATSVEAWVEKVGVAVKSGPRPADLVPAGEGEKYALIWDEDASATSGLALVAAKSLEANALLTQYDNFSGTASGLGLQSSVIRLSEAKDEAASWTLPYTVSPDLLVVSFPNSILPSYSAFNTAGKDTAVLVLAPWTAEDASTKLAEAPPADREALERAQKVQVFDLVGTVKKLARSDITVNLVGAALFAFAHNPSASDSDLVSVVSAAAEASSEPTTAAIKAVREGLQTVKISPADSGALPVATPAAPGEGDDASSAVRDVKKASPSDPSAKPRPSVIVPTAFTANPNKTLPVVATRPANWHAAAHRLLFPEAYRVLAAPTAPEDNKGPGAVAKKDDAGAFLAMRPDVHETTFLVTVSETRRLTPITYDRNVFHIEFDTAGTGLKYEIGEALGVYGWNDSDDVRAFLAEWDWDGEQLIEFPSLQTGLVEQRTLFQVLQQNLDLYGKPGKGFYEALAKVAPTREEKRKLRFIASPEGSNIFKKWADVDTVTYAHVLRAFPGTTKALGVEGLVREVEGVKPRHYSIASSQRAVGDSVHLLVVAVDWDIEGEKRYGQCTRYLADLQVGDKVLVSVKPSVMKLPPLDKQPVIMAGLGTGAAPFRAFLQERAVRREEGIEVGPLVYYFGSRHRSKEYLYGEEIEAYVAEGLLTRTGLAFSRDQKAKIYIQDKMRSDADYLGDLLDAKENGAFYLCGPTWPVPDVYEALIDALKRKGKTEEEAKAYIEQMKEEERYVLEVY